MVVPGFQEVLNGAYPSPQGVNFSAPDYTTTEIPDGSKNHLGGKPNKTWYEMDSWGNHFPGKSYFKAETRILMLRHSPTLF